MVARRNESYGTGGKGNVGEFLSIKSINKDMTGEWCDGEMELVSEVEVHEVTFSAGVQQRLAGVSVVGPSQSYRKESGW